MGTSRSLPSSTGFQKTRPAGDGTRRRNRVPSIPKSDPPDESPNAMYTTIWRRGSMIPNLARYLNKTVLVSIPALFGDALCRPYKLLGAELNGLWLQSEELTNRLLPPEAADFARLEPVVFVPFAQMAGVLVATGVAAPPAAAAAPAGAG